MLFTVTYLKSPQKVRQVDNVLIDAGSRIEAGSQIQAGGFRSLVLIEAGASIWGFTVRNVKTFVLMMLIIWPLPMFIVLSSWQGHCKSSVHFDEVPSSCQLSDQTKILELWVHHLRPLSPFIAITHTYNRACSVGGCNRWKCVVSAEYQIRQHQTLRSWGRRDYVRANNRGQWDRIQAWGWSVQDQYGIQKLVVAYVPESIGPKTDPWATPVTKAVHFVLSYIYWL